MIEIKNLKKSFGDLHVLKGINLSIDEREVVVINNNLEVIRWKQ